MGSVTDVLPLSFSLSLYVYMYAGLYTCMPWRGLLKYTVKCLKDINKISQNFFAEILTLMGSLTATIKKW